MPQPRGMCTPRTGDGAVITTGVFTAVIARPGGIIPDPPLAVPYVRFESAAQLAALRRRAAIIRNRVR